MISGSQAESSVHIGLNDDRCGRRREHIDGRYIFIAARKEAACPPIALGTMFLVLADVSEDIAGQVRRRAFDADNNLGENTPSTGT